jgi:hypothetical protein
MMRVFRRDLLKTLNQFMIIMNEGDPGFRINLPDIQTQDCTTEILSRSINYLVYSREEKKNDDFSIDCHIARELAYDFIMREACLFDEQNRALSAAVLVSPHLDTQEKTSLFQSLLITLILDGQLQEAWELAYIFGACSWIRKNHEKNGTLQRGNEKQAIQISRKLKLLTKFAKLIAENKLPTKMGLRIETFGESFDAAQHTRLLQDMEIRAFIPNAPNNGRKVEYYQISSHTDASLANSFPSIPTAQKIVQNRDETLAPWSSIVPSLNPNMAQSEIRTIRESLGPVYWFLLIQFEMTELQSVEDLEAFLDNLHKIGMTLI